jgi:dipeptidyl aminopeptidase/acylaminoacyl peptidase
LSQRFVPFLFVGLLLLPLAAAAGDKPTVDDLVALKRPGSVALSPDGRTVAYTQREVDWTENEYVTQIWLADAAGGGTPRQVTRGKKSSEGPAWSPDGRQLGFLSERSGKRQVYALDLAGGDATQITNAEEGVLDFAWAPDGRSLAVNILDGKTAARKQRDERYGELELHDEDPIVSHLHVVDLATKQTKRLTQGHQPGPRKRLRRRPLGGHGGRRIGAAPRHAPRPRRDAHVVAGRQGDRVHHHRR